MGNYARCNICEQEFLTKKLIREHLKTKHKVKGGKATRSEVATIGSLKRTPLSENYTRL